MKFFQFHSDNTNSFSATKNRYWLTFLEQICLKLNSQIENFNQLISIHLSWLPCNFKFNQFQAEFDRTYFKLRISHHLAKFLKFPINLTTKIGAFSQFHTIAFDFYHGRTVT
jgi:hypothetical protein